VIECQTCGEIFAAATNYGQGDWHVVHPMLIKRLPAEVPEPIKSEFEEAAKCLSIGAFKACVSTCQITLESIWRDKNVSGLNDLLGNGIISKSLFDKATEIRLWAGIAKHKLCIGDIDPIDAEQLLVYLETLINDVYVEPIRLEEMKRKRDKLK